jgi:predicted PhzF superfamily epimerase YddE/YHI9
MKIQLFQVDAFASRPFTGNPAAVCPLQRWLPDSTLLSIAAENNLSETAFLVPRAASGEWDLRWFTPRVEVDLCGHATLASAHILSTEIESASQHFGFATKSRLLRVSRSGAVYRLDFPLRASEPVPLDPCVVAALGGLPLDAWRSRDLVVRYSSAAEVRALRPDLQALAAVDAFAVVATAPGTDADADVDFVSRFFAPAKGVPEDPVTGSAHCTLAPFWKARLAHALDGGQRYRARQVGPRGGELECECEERRVILYGRAVTVLRGELEF